jgi:hypothetical protein
MVGTVDVAVETAVAVAGTGVAAGALVNVGRGTRVGVGVGVGCAGVRQALRARAPRAARRTTKRTRTAPDRTDMAIS